MVAEITKHIDCPLGLKCFKSCYFWDWDKNKCTYLWDNDRNKCTYKEFKDNILNYSEVKEEVKDES